MKNFSESKSGKRRGTKVGFPRFENRHSRQAVTFVELAEGVDHRHWINPDTRSHVRLMLPQRAGDGTWERRHTRPKSQQAAGRNRRDEVAWLHTHQPDAVSEVWRLCETGRAKVQALTIEYEGGRWKAVLRLRLLDGSTRLRNPGDPVKYHGGSVGVDLGSEHLVTLDRPIDGLTDEHGHVPNPRVLERTSGAGRPVLPQFADVFTVRDESRAPTVATRLRLQPLRTRPRPGRERGTQHPRRSRTPDARNSTRRTRTTSPRYAGRRETAS